MTVLEAIMQGVIQGATEFLPVSSSGHLSISQHLMGLNLNSLMFDVLLHLGTLLAVVFVYRGLLVRLFVTFFSTLREIMTGKFRWSKRTDDQNLLGMLFLGLLPLGLLFVPVAGTGKQIKDFADAWATDGDILLEGAALLVTSLLLTLGIRADTRRANSRSTYRVRDALAVGLAQCAAAVFPGISRSGATWSIGVLCTVERKKALDYSFVLGLPAILAAVVLSVGDAVHEPLQIGTAPLIAGMTAAAAVGFLAIKAFQWMAASNRMKLFAWYTFAAGLATIILGIVEHCTGTAIFSGTPLT